MQEAINAALRSGSKGLGQNNKKRFHNANIKEYTDFNSIKSFKDILDICKKMGIEAKKRVKDNFQWYNYGERYLKNINDIQ